MSEEKQVEKDLKETSKQRKRIVRSFPAGTFEDSLEIAVAIQEHASGQKIRRLTLFDHLGKSPDSGGSRQLVTNSSRYGLTKGNYSSEYLELTPEGFTATNSESSPSEKLQARFSLAINSIAPFKEMYEQYKNAKLPSKTVLIDFLKEHGYTDEETSECVDIFIVNAKQLGILTNVAGAERILPIEHLLEGLQNKSEPAKKPSLETSSVTMPKSSRKSSSINWDRTCFYIAPIGEPDTETRQHSDLFLNSIVDPALKEFELDVVRADKISEPGIITSQVIEHIIRSRLVVADLSFHNPNVFYELSLRHACRLPTVQLIRKMDKIPFDLDQFRTIKIDTTSIYTLVPQLEIYRSQIAEQVRSSLNDPDSVDNPITAFCKTLRVTF